MAVTQVSTDDKIAIKIQSAKLFTNSLGQSFWINKLAGDFLPKDKPKTVFGSDSNYPIVKIRDLTKGKGDEVSVDLFTDLKGNPLYDNDIMSGKEANLRWFTDSLKIGVIKRSAHAGGIMDRKRTVYDLRAQARRILERYFARVLDESITVYLAGRRGIGTSQWVLSTTWNGFAGNPLQQPDPEHTFAVDGTGNIVADPAQADVMKLSHLDKLERFIALMDVPPNPISINGENYYLVVLSPYAVEQLKSETGTKTWTEIQMNANKRGMENPIFRDSLGVYGQFILYSYSKIPIFQAGGNNISHNLVLGTQAAAIAWGDFGEGAVKWEEEWKDYRNFLGVGAYMMLGIKKLRFDGKDFGSIAFYTKN